MKKYELSDRLEYLMRIGLVKRSRLTQYKLAFKDPSNNMKFAHYREKLLEVFFKIFDIISDHDPIFEKVRQQVLIRYRPKRIKMKNIKETLAEMAKNKPDPVSHYRDSLAKLKEKGDHEDHLKAVDKLHNLAKKDQTLNNFHRQSLVGAVNAAKNKIQSRIDSKQNTSQDIEKLIPKPEAEKPASKVLSGILNKVKNIGAEKRDKKASDQKARAKEYDETKSSVETDLVRKAADMRRDAINDKRTTRSGRETIPSAIKTAFTNFRANRTQSPKNIERETRKRLKQKAQLNRARDKYVRGESIQYVKNRMLEILDEKKTFEPAYSGNGSARNVEVEEQTIGPSGGQEKRTTENSAEQAKKDRDARQRENESKARQRQRAQEARQREMEAKQNRMNKK